VTIWADIWTDIWEDIWAADAEPVVAVGNAKFGEKKFGAFKFGATTVDSARFALEVDWDQNGQLDGTREKNLRDWSSERGRQYTISPDGESFEAEETGKFQATFYDPDRRYDFYNASSPLYGMLSGGKLFKMIARTPEDAFYNVMCGFLEEPKSYGDNGVAMATLTGEDGWGFLRDQAGTVTIPLQENIYVDEAMRMILDEAGWPNMWARSLDAGVDLRPYYWVDAKSPAKSLHELAANELGSVCIDASGALRFRSRLSLEDEVLTITHDDCLPNGVRRALPREVIRNVLKVRTTPRSEKALQAVWTLTGTLELNPGETVDEIWAEYEYNGSAVPVKSPVAPVGTTDFLANSSSDGSGTDLTANISVSLYSFSTRGKLAFTNNGLTKAYITSAQIRGIPVAASNATTFQYTDSQSIKQFGPRPFTMQIDQNANIARQYRELLALFMPMAKDFLIVDLIPNPEVQFAVDLGQVIRGRFSVYDVDQAYRVIKISHKNKGNVTRTTWWLEPFMRLFAGAQVPMQVPFQLGGA
jgi:hypothetical protein